LYLGTARRFLYFSVIDSDFDEFFILSLSESSCKIQSASKHYALYLGTARRFLYFSVIDSDTIPK
ncbi:MAG: hypothetical protein RSG57_01365, partial [Christensenellaceae bacterium]